MCCAVESKLIGGIGKLGIKITSPVNINVDKLNIRMMKINTNVDEFDVTECENNNLFSFS